MTPIAIGLDLSLTGSGIASSAGWCERVGAKDITTMDLIDRLAAVDDLVDRIVLLCRNADLVVVEVPAFSRTGGGALERGGLWWLVVRRLWIGEVPTAEAFNQHRMRYATGKPAAHKGAIVDAVARRWPQFETGGDDNLADSAVLAAMGADWLGHPLTPMPNTHRQALDKVRWPDRNTLGHSDDPQGPFRDGPMLAQPVIDVDLPPPGADTYATTTTGGI